MFLLFYKYLLIIIYLTQQFHIFSTTFNHIHFFVSKFESFFFSTKWPLVQVRIGRLLKMLRCVLAGLKLLMIQLGVMRCSCEKCRVLFIPVFLRKLVGKEPKNRCPVVGNYLANRLVHGETPWHKLLVIFEVGKITRIR